MCWKCWIPCGVSTLLISVWDVQQQCKTIWQVISQLKTHQYVRYPDIYTLHSIYGKLTLLSSFLMICFYAWDFMEIEQSKFKSLGSHQ